MYEEKQIKLTEEERMRLIELGSYMFVELSKEDKELNLFKQQQGI